MARLPEPSRKQPRQQGRGPQHVTSQLDHAETISGRWLVKAILATLVAAGVALYLTVCLLFYQGQWQFVFFPPSGAAHRQALHKDSLASSWARRTAPQPAPAPISAAAAAASSGLPIHNHPFDYTEEGVAQLDGWWIPASNDVRAQPQADALASMVLVFCPNGRSDLPQNIPAFRAFHALGISVFAFDYRGFGASQAGHPSQQKAYEDGSAALRYLIGTRHVDPGHIIVYGAEVGSAVAVHVAQQFPQIAGVILENPQPSLAKEVKREQHIHLLPMWLVFRDRFDISSVVPSLKMPKLVIATPAKPEYLKGSSEIYDEAPGPKQKAQIAAGDAEPLYARPEWRQAIVAFLNTIRPVHR